MSIKATCTCGAEFKVKPELAGKRVKCPKCGDTFAVPKPQTAEPRIRVTCQCGKAVKAERELAGKRVKCPGCGRALDIPRPSVKANRSRSGDDSSGASNNAAGPVASASPEAVLAADHGQAEPSKSNRRRYVLIGVGVVVAVLLFIVVGLGLFRDPPTITNSIGMELVLIPAGEFMMGSAESDDEKPQHKVRITEPFYFGVTEVTQGQWEAVMGTRPWSGSNYVKEGSDYPATSVRWVDAVEFCTKLSLKEGVTYRLPTEAEWEYACRGGTTTVYHFGDDASRLSEYAWFSDNAKKVDEKYAHRVGQKKANPFGLYDMHGNVYEWCADRYDSDYYEGSPTDDPTGPTTGSSRVLRGGAWDYNAQVCRSANRRSRPRNAQSVNGFRIVLVEKPYPDVLAEAKPTVEAVAAQKEQQECGQRLGLPVEITNSIGTKLVLIPAGEFVMGSPESDDDAWSFEKPQHRVRITKPFYFGVYEVTQAEYEKGMGKNPSRDKGTNNPVEKVSWKDAVEFCRRLSAKEGKTYRLPTEAEWEYACRAGTTTRWSFGDDPANIHEYAWDYNGQHQFDPVGKKKPNAWGLHDMHGNVMEWCQDWYAGDYYAISPTDDPPGPETGSDRVCRGGCAAQFASALRSATRGCGFPGLRERLHGFRLVLVPSGK